MTDNNGRKRTVTWGAINPKGGYLAKVMLHNRHPDDGEEVDRYAFKRIHDDMADVIRGDIPDTDGIPVMLVGGSLAKNYWVSKEKTIPRDVVKAMIEKNLTLVENVDGGWDDWGGRPEFSDTYADFTDAEVIDPQVELESRDE